MPLIGRAWKANVNVWKKHLTLQSVFNRGECMMHVDKNADDHVVDQNVDRISREIAYVPFGGGIKSKHSFWKKKMSTKHAYQRFNGFEVLDVLLRGPMDWILDVVPRGSMVWSLDVLPKGPMDWNLEVIPRGPMDLKFRCASQRFDGLKFGRAS